MPKWTVNKITQIRVLPTKHINKRKPCDNNEGDGAHKIDIIIEKFIRVIEKTKPRSS